MEDSVVCSWTLDPASQDVPHFLTADATPCEIRCTSRQPIAAMHISCSAGTCELRTADQAYVATVKGVDRPGGGCNFRVDVQAFCRPPVHEIVLRMLSLRDKRRFCLHALEVVAAEESTTKEPEAKPPLQVSQMEEVRQLLQDAQLGAKGDSRQQLMASIATAALTQEVFQRQLDKDAWRREEQGWEVDEGSGLAASCANDGSSSPNVVAAGRVTSVKAFEAAIKAATDRALDKYKKGVEEILEQSLATFESRLGRMFQRLEPGNPL